MTQQLRAKKRFMVVMERYTDQQISCLFYLLQITVHLRVFRHMFRRKLYALGHPNPEENYQEESRQKCLVIWLEGQFINAYK